MAILEKLHGKAIEEEREEYDEMRKSAQVIKVPYDLFMSWVKPDAPTDVKG